MDWKNKLFKSLMEEPRAFFPLRSLGKRMVVLADVVYIITKCYTHHFWLFTVRLFGIKIDSKILPQLIVF